MLVHVAAKRIRQIREGAQYLVHSPKKEDIAIALREIAAGKISIDGKESEDQEEKRRKKMEKLQKDKVTAREAKPAVKETTMKKSASKEATVKTAGIKKEYVESNAKSVYIAGDFNNWNIHANPMKRLENGDYDISLELEPGGEYQFRYLIDESKWENDWNADKYVKSPFGDSDNSVIIV